ncbi:MAG: Calx-beta domain-containing protein, partial [Allosphingosinicella sp.]
AGGVTFDIATADGTATIAGGDYVARALTGQTIPAGSTSYTFDVTVNGDINVESNENFVVNVTNVVNASVADGQGIGTITDNDVPPTLSIADVTKTEGDSGTQTYTFTVSLSSPAPAGGVTFDIATADGTATSADGDYVARALTGQTIPAGSTSYTFDVTVGGDLKIDANEGFFVNVTNVVGANVGDGQATGTITNNDVLPTVSVGDATVVEGNGGVSYLVFTVSLNKAWTDAVTIDYATSNGTATAGADYLAIGGSLSFAAGETSKTVSVPVIGDHVAELAETVNLTLSNVSGATIADGGAVGTITDDDFVNYFSLASGNFSENWTDTSRISANDDWSKIASIRGYLGDIDPAGAVTGVDPRTLTGANNGAIDVIANLNATTSTSGGVGEFQLADPTIGLQGSGTADAPSIVLFLDASGRTDIHLTANLRDIDTTADNAVQQVAVQYRTDPNGAWTNAPGGYFADVTTGGSATQVTALDITLPPEANNAPTLQVRILTTNAAGNDEWVGIDDIVVSSAQAATPSYAIADAAVFEGTTLGEPTPIAFTVTRTGDASQAGDVDYAITFPGGGFSAGASDLTSELSGSVHFNAGETSATITLGIVADFTPEADEAFTVTLSNPSSGTITHASATGTIVNDDGAPPFVSISDVTQVEGDTGTSVFTFTVTRTGGTGAFSVDYATADGSASAASDYAAKSGTLDFAAGETSKTISVTVNGDLAGETSETFSVNLANPTGFAVLADATGTGTILNDDVIPIYEIQGSGHTSPLAGQGVKTQGIVTAVAFNGYYIQDPTGDGNDATSDGVFVFTGTAPSGIAVGDLVQVTGTVNEFVAGTGDLSVTEITSPTASVLSTGNALPAATLIGVGGRMPPTENGPGNGLGNALAFYESMEGMRVTVKAPLVVSDTNSFGETWVVASGGTGATGVNDRGGITLSAGDLNPERIQIDDDSTIFSGYSPHHTTGDLLSDVTGILNYSHTSYEVLVTQAVTTTTDVTLGQETTSLAGDLNHLTVASYNIENADITDGQGKFDILAQNIVYNLAAPDIIGLQEIQDADGPGNGSDLSGQVTAQLLIDAIKAIGGPNYVYIEIAPTTPNTSGGEPGGNIRPGFLYNADRVTYVEGSAHILTDPAFNGSRKPLIADFLFNGQKVELIDVHFTSRLGSSELEGATQPPIDAGDSSRTAMGVAVHNYIAGALATDPSLKLGVVGDFNGFYFEGAVGAIENGGVLTDLHRTLAPEERYSYLFDGNNQAIDHIIVTQNLADGAQFDAVHLNSQFPNNSTRPTDHDPVIARFSIPNPNPQLDLDAQAPGTGASNAVVEQDAVATFIAPNATVSDADSPDFAGGTLTVTISANGQTGDVLSIGDTPAITVSDGKLLYNGTEIATVAGGGDATTPLVVTFEASANAAAVQDVVRAIAFAHDSDAPSSAVRTVHYALTDGDGGSGAADASVTVQPVNDAPELTAPTQASVTYTEGDPSVAILQGVTLSDPDLPASFTGGSLVIDVAGATGGLNLKAGSNFVINDNGDGSFSLAIVVTGTQIGFGTISGFGTTHLAITGLTGAATLARVNDLIDDFTFVKAGDAVEDATGTITVTFTDGNNVGSVLDTALCDEQAQGLSVVGVDDAVVVDLNGEAAGSNNAVTFTEGDSPVALAPAGTVTDPDTCSPDFAGGTVSVQIGDGATADDLLLISGPCFVVDEGVLYYQGTEVGTVSGTVTGSLTVVFNDQGSPALAQALVEAVAFANYSSAPTEGDRVVTFTLTDSHGAASAPVTA